MPQHERELRWAAPRSRPRGMIEASRPLAQMDRVHHTSLLVASLDHTLDAIRKEAGSGKFERSKRREEARTRVLTLGLLTHRSEAAPKI